MIGPGTDAALFENDDYENDGPFDDDQDQEQDEDDGAYGADDDWPADACGPLYDGR